ncbi:hypothetical protein JK635_23010 [Neobacillus sp. YIM B02564]|jgi:hypothetical protein|uniref:Uncharacterized protein n=1 Tax=Neobacillus paridis TaxID=2803862 RepID=A0ABS1TUP1_9BACI|nr:hypothetical protein [Neobacillus paridis]MBL4955032.1 hypothetical protein [Neobacillus paridis]
MLGELIEVVKFLIEIFKGNIPGTQLYVMLGIIIIVVAAEIIYEIRKKQYKILNLIVERFFLNTIGVIFYLSFYMFSLKLIMKVLPSLIPDYSIELGSWLAIISYTSMIILAPLAIYAAKHKNPIVKVIGATIHTIIIGLLINLMNFYWKPNIEFPILLLILNMFVNTALSFVIIIYGTAIDNKEKNKPKSKTTSS